MQKEFHGNYRGALKPINQNSTLYKTKVGKKIEELPLQGSQHEDKYSIHSTLFQLPEIDISFEKLSPP